MPKTKVKTIKEAPKFVPKFGGPPIFRGEGFGPKAGNQIKVGPPRITQHKGGS